MAHGTEKKLERVPLVRSRMLFGIQLIVRRAGVSKASAKKNLRASLALWPHGHVI